MTKITILLVMEVFHLLFVFAFTVPLISKIKYEAEKT